MTGSTGQRGPQGSVGDPGPVGATGQMGSQGPQGIQGPAGAQGQQGSRGPQGSYSGSINRSEDVVHEGPRPLPRLCTQVSRVNGANRVLPVQQVRLAVRSSLTTSARLTTVVAMTSAWTRTTATAACAEPAITSCHSRISTVKVKVICSKVADCMQ